MGQRRQKTFVKLPSPQERAAIKNAVLALHDDIRPKSQPAVARQLVFVFIQTLD
jgi:hypothetical protein